MTRKLKQGVILVAKVIALTVVLMILSAIGSKFLPATAAGGEAAEPAASQPAPPPSGGFMALILTVLLVQVVALAVPIVRSRWSGWGLAATVFVVYFGTVTLLNQIESLVYLEGKMPEGFVAGLVAMGLFTSALFAPIAVLILGRWKPAPSPDRQEALRPGTGLGRWAWRVPAAAAIYLALYYIFGYYVAWQSPELRAYYGGTDPGSFFLQMGGIVRTLPWMLAVQFARGLGWVVLGLLVIRSMRGPWWQGGLATALIFAVPSFYLLLPNPIMPEAVTRLHFIETLPYQLLFGFFLGWFFRARTPAVGHAAAVPAR